MQRATNRESDHCSNYSSSICSFHQLGRVHLACSAFVVVVLPKQTNPVVASSSAAAAAVASVAETVNR